MTWETDFRRFEKTDMDYIPGRKDHTGVLLLDWDWHRIGVFFIIRDARAVQRLERVFTFSFPSTSLFFSLVSSVLSLHLARCHACMDAQVGSAFQVPSHFVCSLLCSSSSKGTGSQDRFSIRSDQVNPPINQRKNKSKQHSSAVLCVSTE